MLIPGAVYGPVNLFVSVMLAVHGIMLHNNRGEDVDEVIKPVYGVRATPFNSLFLGGSLEIEERVPVADFGQHALRWLAIAIMLEVGDEIQEVSISVY